MKMKVEPTPDLIQSAEIFVADLAAAGISLSDAEIFVRHVGADALRGIGVKDEAHIRSVGDDAIALLRLAEAHRKALQ